MKEAYNPNNYLADNLCSLLADTYVLYLKSQNFHWNVKGESFLKLYELFERQFNDLAIGIDMLAHRIRTLGARTPGSFTEFNQLSSLKEDSLEVSSSEMICSLLKDHNVVIGKTKNSLALAKENGDEVTSDVLLTRLKEHENCAWMLHNLIL